MRWAAALTRVLTVVLLPALAGCGAGAPAGGVETRRDSAGIQVVNHRGADVALPWSFSPAWSVGGSSDDRLPLVELGVHQLSVGPAGHIAILDEAGYRVLLFSPEGQFLRAIGREGGGPGELLSPAALTQQDDGTIVVYDVGKQAFVRWSIDGELYPETGMAVPFWGPKLKVSSRGNVIFTALAAGDADTSEQWLVEWNADRELRLARVRRMADRMVISPEAELWVKRRVVRNEPGRIDVFSRDGAYLGTLPPEAPFPAAFLPDGRIIALEPDLFDASRMVAYSITRR